MQRDTHASSFLNILHFPPPSQPSPLYTPPTYPKPTTYYPLPQTNYHQPPTSSTTPPFFVSRNPRIRGIGERKIGNWGIGESGIGDSGNRGYYTTFVAEAVEGEGAEGAGLLPVMAVGALPVTILGDFMSLVPGDTCVPGEGDLGAREVWVRAWGAAGEEMGENEEAGMGEGGW
eukprot:CAMPEP_0173179616 /NCGR_PEP_ID=MMETSP1141-20130122/6231_1 /TAXON_ID=483371 /ORGANISM="non described non described, Strain CCMP2298" /LENGTH=173 /DNA_ID=CAMNT_0014102319 /DNA_START=93 /DNA_END=612 /DNA_ORIENTATION=+